MVDVLFIV